MASPDERVDGLQPVLAVNQADPRLIRLGFAFTAWVSAEEGLREMIGLLLDDGLTIRDLAAGCGLVPRTMQELLIRLKVNNDSDNQGRPSRQ